MNASSSVSYRSLFQTPETVIFFIATVIGRIPIAMKALGCVLLVQQLTGSYGLAGLVGAVQTLVSAFAAPQLGRLADQFGERTVLIWSAIGHVIGMVWLIAAAYADTHALIMLAGAAVVGGSSMPFGSISRTRWVEVLGKGRRLERAYALEAMADEMAFIIGPMLVVPLSVSVNAAAGLVVSLVMTLIGTVILVLQPVSPSSTRNAPVTTAQSTVSTSVVRLPGMQVLIAALLFLGIIFGSIEIVLVAFSEDLAQPNAASILAALFGAGSFLGAIGYGAVTWHSPVDRRLKIAIWWMSLGTIPILLASSIPAMAIAVFVTGFGISPAMIAANTVVENLSPPKMLTEAFSWLGSAIASGAALGSIVAGYVLDEIGVRAGQSLGLIGGILSALVVIVWAKYLRQERPPEPVG